jgi:hypothetical protein
MDKRDIDRESQTRKGRRKNNSVTEYVQQLVLQEHHRVLVPDGGLDQALGVGGRIRRHHLEARHTAVPVR